MKNLLQQQCGQLAHTHKKQTAKGIHNYSPASQILRTPRDFYSSCCHYPNSIIKIHHGGPALVTINEYNGCYIAVSNTALYDIDLDWNTKIRFVDFFGQLNRPSKIGWKFVDEIHLCVGHHNADQSHRQGHRKTCQCQSPSLLKFETCKSNRSRSSGGHQHRQIWPWTRNKISTQDTCSGILTILVLSRPSTRA